MALSTPIKREYIHAPTIVFHGYLRTDSLWDMEAELLDQREYHYTARDLAAVPPPRTAHNIRYSRRASRPTSSCN